MPSKKWEKRLAAQIPNLLRYARALTRNEELAEDLVQDCLERAWSRRMLWDSKRELRPWLFSIMHNLYVNQVRKLENKQTLVSMDSVDIADGAGEGKDLLVLRDFELCLGKLNPEAREIILLAGLENLTYKEIAQVMSIPVGTVMSRLYRAREQLNQLMSGQDGSNIVRLT